MRITKFARDLIGIASLFVSDVRIENDIIIGVRPSWRNPRCSSCGKRAPGYDSRKKRRWVHLAVGRLRIVLEYAPQRVDCLRCGIRIEKVPWARAGSRFTTDFEEMTSHLARTTNQTAVSKLMGISWKTVGKIVERVVAERLPTDRLDGLKRIGVDEFSYLKRNNYITVVVDHDTRKVVWATDVDPITQEVGIEFYEIDPEAVRLLEEAIGPDLIPVGLH